MRSPLPEAELRGRLVPMKKSWYPNRVGPESDEAWERCVPLNSFDRATWAKQKNISKTSARRAPNWQQLRLYNGLILSRRRSSSGTHHLLPSLLWVLDSQDQIRQVRELQSVQNTLLSNPTSIRLISLNPPPKMSWLPLNISIMSVRIHRDNAHIYKWLITKVESSIHVFAVYLLN